MKAKKLANGEQILSETQIDEIEIVSYKRMLANGVDSNISWSMERYNMYVSRSVVEIVRRAGCLFLCASKAEGLESNIVKDLVKDFYLEPHLQIDELQFIYEQKIFEDEEVRFFQWGFEASQVLLWSLNLIDDLPDLINTCDPNKLSQVFVNTPGIKFPSNFAKLKDQVELIQEANYNFCVFSHCCSSLPPYQKVKGGYMPAVAFQREKAYRWLFEGQMEAWENIKVLIEPGDKG